MIKKESLQSYQELLTFWTATGTRFMIPGSTIDTQRLYRVEQYPPLSPVKLYSALELTAAFGTSDHLHFLLDFEQTFNLKVKKCLFLAIRNGNEDNYFYLKKRFHLKAQYKTFQDIDSPFTLANLLTESFEAAAISNNNVIMQDLLKLDLSGYGALGVQYSHGLKQTPLFLAAEANAIYTFKSLLQNPRIQHYFLSQYLDFCHNIEQPSDELLKEILKLQPADIQLPAHLNRKMLHGSKIKVSQNNFLNTHSSSETKELTDINLSTRMNMNIL